MKVYYILCALFMLSPITNAQDIQGSWKWSNDKYEGVAEIDSNIYHSVIYFKGSDTKVLEIYNYYLIDKTRLYLSEEPFIASTDKKSKTLYRFKSNGDNQFILTGNLGAETYTRERPSGKPVQYKANEFYININKKLTCYNEEGIPTKTGACLSIGGISFYSTLDDVKNKFGGPLQSGFDEESNQWYAFYTDPKDRKSPILTITIKDSKIIRLNLKGYKSKDDITFSSIRLGDFYSFVKQRLGEPGYKKEVKAAGDETWVYVVAPITIEFRHNKVSSITIEPFQL